MNNLVVSQNSKSSVSELTLKYFLVKYLFSTLPPLLCTSAGQDKLKDVHTLFDPDLLQCQYLRSIVFMLQSFAVSAESIRGVIVQRVSEGQLGFFPG